MNEDGLILLGGYLVLGVTVTAVSARSVNKWKTALTHLTIHLLYSAPLLYGLLALSKEGNTLAWWFYLVLALCIHLLVCGSLLVRHFIIRPKAL